LLLLNFISLCEAGVYHCVSENCSMESRYKPCDPTLESQTFLPIAYHKTDPAALKKEQKQIDKSIEQQKKLERRESRNQQQDKKLAEKKAKRILRQKTLCQKAIEKMAFLSDQLRVSHKIKRHLSLERQLEETTLKEKRYCHEQ
jgi:hypothetical protein